MMPLEDQHRPQSDCRSTTATDVDTQSLGLEQELITFGTVKCNESTLAFPSQILELMRIFIGQTFDTSIEIVTNRSRVLDQIQSLNLTDDSTEE